MKRISLLMTIALVTIATMAFSQSKNKSVEVLYFKAKQYACKTRACDALENQLSAQKGNTQLPVQKCVHFA